MRLKHFSITPTGKNLFELAWANDLFQGMKRLKLTFLTITQLKKIWNFDGIFLMPYFWFGTLLRTKH